ncbi:F-box domain containing protein [Tanacetum coccineum]
MSDNIPLDIQMEIMQRLPVNSLLQFRTISKTWKSFINGRNFLVSYGVSLTQPSRFLVSYALGTGEVFAWIVVFFSYKFAALWNPSIRKSVGVAVPYDPSKACIEKIAFGFGVHPKTLDPTIIKISYPDSRKGL